MDITPAAVAAQRTANLRASFAVGVLRKAIDFSQQEGAQLVKLIESAGAVGTKVDLVA
jgi:hypothetical protein